MSQLFFSYLTHVFNKIYSEHIVPICYKYLTEKERKYVLSKLDSILGDIFYTLCLNPLDSSLMKFSEIFGQLNELVLYLSTKQYKGSQELIQAFYRLIEETKNYFQQKAGKTPTLEAPEIIRCSLVVKDQQNRPLSLALVRISSANLPDFNSLEKIADENGRVTFTLPRGKYLVRVYKKSEDFYVWEQKEVELTHGSVEVKVTSRRYTRKRFSPLLDLLERENLPAFSDWDLVPHVLTNRSLMTAAIAHQLKTLGKFCGIRIIDLKYNCTGIQRLWDVFIHDEILDRLALFTHPVDILLRTERGIIALRIESLYEIMRGNYGLDIAEEYFNLGVDYSCVIHPVFPSGALYQTITDYLKATNSSLGYLQYSISSLSVLKFPNTNPYMQKPDVEERARFLKNYFASISSEKPVEKTMDRCRRDFLCEKF